MSKRRKQGDWVWLVPEIGCTGASKPYYAKIIDEQPHWSCMYDCEDQECMEWDNLETEPDKNGQIHYIHHVNECYMKDTLEEVLDTIKNNIK